MERPNTSEGQLRSLADRIDRLDEEIGALNTDKKEVYAEAKGAGFDTKILKAAIARRRKLRDAPHDTVEADTLLDLYLGAILGGEDAETPSAGSVAPAKGHPEKPSRVRVQAREEIDPETGEITEPHQPSGLPAGQESREDAAPHPLPSEASATSPTQTAETAAPTPTASDASLPGHASIAGAGEAGDTSPSASPTITEDVELPDCLRRGRAA